jgi:hypothetical protein
MPRGRVDVRLTLPQRRYAESDHVEPVIQVAWTVPPEQVSLN